MMEIQIGQGKEIGSGWDYCAGYLTKSQGSQGGHHQYLQSTMPIGGIDGGTPSRVQGGCEKVDVCPWCASVIRFACPICLLYAEPSANPAPHSMEWRPLRHRWLPWLLSEKIK